MPPFAQQLARRFKERLLQALPGRIVDVRIFGSMARAEGTEASDLDLFVLVDHMDRALKHTIYDTAWDVGDELDCGPLLAPLVMDVPHFEELRRRELLIAQEIERDGISV